MSELPRIISVDDHVLEPPDLLQSRLPARYRDRGPRIARLRVRREGARWFEAADGNWCDVWLYDDLFSPLIMLSAAVGFDHLSFDVTTFDEVRPGAWRQKERLEDMDTNYCDAAICFPNTLPRFCGQTFAEREDKELALLCVQAYNDWMIDEWCAAAPGRYIPLTLIPLWDPAEAVKEIQRTADKGSRSIAFSENFEPLGLPTVNSPTRYWDPVFAAAQECQQVFSIHIGSSSTMYKVASDSPFIANMSLGLIRPAGCLLSWIFGGIFQRFPKIQVALSEGSIGWIPWVLERARQVHDIQGHWVARGIQFEGVSEGAHGKFDSSIDLWAIDVYRDYREHFYGCFIDDATGLRMLDVVGEDNVMVEMDYPHSDSTWPDTLKLSKERLDEAAISGEVQQKILRGNAEKLYRFSPSF